MISGFGHAQVKDTLQKIRESGVIELGGRDASLPFSYKVGGALSIDVVTR